MPEAFTRERILSPSPPAHVVVIRSGRRQFQENFRTVGVRVLLHLTRAELSGLDGKNAEILVNNHLIRSESYKKVFLCLCKLQKSSFGQRKNVFPVWRLIFNLKKADSLKNEESAFSLLDKCRKIQYNQDTTHKQRGMMLCEPEKAGSPELKNKKGYLRSFCGVAD